MVADPYFDLWIKGAIFFKDGQYTAIKRHLACRNIYCSALQVFAAGYFFLPRFNVFEGNSDVGLKLFAFGSELHSAVGAHKKRAAKLSFEVFYRSGKVGLIVHQHFCRLRNVSVLGDIIKYPIIIIIDIVHISPLLIYAKYINVKQKIHLTYISICIIPFCQLFVNRQIKNFVKKITICFSGAFPDCFTKHFAEKALLLASHTKLYLPFLL